MNASEEFYKFAEELAGNLQKVSFIELDRYEGRIISWRRGQRIGSITITVEIIATGYKRVTIEGGLPGRVFKLLSTSYKKRFRAYQSGVRIPEVQ